jgi:uncharacterized membrane protein YfcA
MPALTAAFALTALLYAAVGFGGGSTYAALLALVGFDYRLLPILALCCNIVVVTGSTIRFARAGLLPWRGALSVTVLAAPMALLGGLTPIGERTFLAILGLCLLATGLLLIVQRARHEDAPAHPLARFAPLAAAPLGYVAGLVGIGGGIFLAPLLHLLRWRDARGVAASAAFFILVNSFFGLIGQLAKNGADRFGEALSGGLPLLIAVAIGGQIGSLLAVRFLPRRLIRWLTAVLTIWVGARLLFTVYA